MNDGQWRTLLRTCARVLGAGEQLATASRSWCAWTTFESLRSTLHYWSAGIPAEEYLGIAGTVDGGPWGQPFVYQELAHLVVPRTFYWERIESSEFESGTRGQDLERLSQELLLAGIEHRKSELVLEVKLY